MEYIKIDRKKPHTYEFVLEFEGAVPTNEEVFFTLESISPQLLISFPCKKGKQETYTVKIPPLESHFGEGNYTFTINVKFDGHYLEGLKGTAEIKDGIQSTQVIVKPASNKQEDSTKEESSDNKNADTKKEAPQTKPKTVGLESKPELKPIPKSKPEAKSKPESKSKPASPRKQEVKETTQSAVIHPMKNNIDRPHGDYEQVSSKANDKSVNVSEIERRQPINARDELQKIERDKKARQILEEQRRAQLERKKEAALRQTAANNTTSATLSEKEQAANQSSAMDHKQKLDEIQRQIQKDRKAKEILKGLKKPKTDTGFEF